ncbi:hypothetical protein ACQPZ8_18555 [Actinomadura nitritigenes]|uniref:hypothetical protein n=1 Tax=Actinomadura nitritigenes TaxID=134602 RepID=UPI003D8C4339
MPSRALPYPLFDADNHLYETERVARPGAQEAYFKMLMDEQGVQRKKMPQDPVTCVDDLAALPGDAQAKIMGGNLSRLIPV